MRTTAMLAIAALIVLLGAETEATPQFFVTLHASDSFGHNDTFTTPPFNTVPITGVSIGSGGAVPDQAVVSGAALPGRLSVFVSTDTPTELGADGIQRQTAPPARADVEAGFILSDVIFTGPGQAVTTRQSVYIDGIVGASDEFSTITVPVTLSFLAPGASSISFFGCTGAPVTETVPGFPKRGGCAPAGPPPTGFPFNLDLSNTNNAFISTPVFTVPTGVPISVRWEIDAFAIGNAAADFSSTLSFPPSGPVFDLPPGFTVNSSEGLIRDNQWLGASASVPEPGSLWLLTLGVVGGVSARRYERWRARDN